MNTDKTRREAAKRLGIELFNDYRGLVEANSESEIQTAAIELGNTFNKNVEFIINVLKHYGGLEVRFEPMTKPKSGTIDAKGLPLVPAIFRAGADVDTPKKKTN